MTTERRFDPTAGRDARVAQQNRERTAAGDAKDRVQADAAEIARRGQEAARKQQEVRLQHERFQRDLAHAEALDDQAQQPAAEAARKEALERAPSIVDKGRRDFPAPQAESGMVQTVADTSWEKNIAALPKREVPKPQVKKRTWDPRTWI